MDLATAVHGYKLDLQSERKSTNTITWYLSKLRCFTRFLEDEHGVSDLGDVLPDDPAPNLPSLISRIFSGYGPNWGGLQTRWV